MKLKIVVHLADEGGYWAEVPALPGCMSQGETRREAVENLREAIAAWLAASGDRTPIPRDAEFEEIDV